MNLEPGNLHISPLSRLFRKINFYWVKFWFNLYLNLTVTINEMDTFIQNVFYHLNWKVYKFEPTSK